MLVGLYKLWASIQCYNEKAVQDKDLMAKVPTWEIPTADCPKMKSILMMMERIKDMYIQLEASEQPNFMILGCQILHLLYTDQELNRTDEVAEQFATAFKNKLASAVDEPDLILEWGIAAILEPQQKLLGKFCHIFDLICGFK